MGVFARNNLTLGPSPLWKVVPLLCGVPEPRVFPGLYAFRQSSDSGALANVFSTFGEAFCHAHECYLPQLKEGRYPGRYLYLQSLVNSIGIQCFSLSQLLKGTEIKINKIGSGSFLDGSACLALARGIIEKCANLDYLFLTDFASEKEKEIRFHQIHAREYIDRYRRYKESPNPQAFASYEAALADIQKIRELGLEIDDVDWLKATRSQLDTFLIKPSLKERVESMGLIDLNGFDFYWFYSNHAHGDLTAQDYFRTVIGQKSNKGMYSVLLPTYTALAICLNRLTNHFKESVPEFEQQIPKETWRLSHFFAELAFRSIIQNPDRLAKYAKLKKGATEEL